ncbi:MAG TPA: SRPBCC family protein [Solirubrobacterales bacterium]|nr:SRPBCC family protein [Solirubrobacterales bacterium]
MTEHAILEELDGRPVLRFERVLSHPPERVWRSLTEPEEMRAWHPTPARFEPEVGGRVEYVEGSNVADMPDGEVLEYEPPRLLAYTWFVAARGTDRLRWELHPREEGCLLVLLHSFADRTTAANYGAGWHLCLDSLAERLGGGPGRGGAPSPSEEPWQRLNAEYERSFGIAPEQATSPTRA